MKTRNEARLQAAVAPRRPAAGMVHGRAEAGTGAAQAVERSPRMVAQRLRIEELLDGPARRPARAPGASAAGVSSHLPADLRAGIESVAGQRLPDVRVHYNSPRAAALQAHAIAQGAEIHLGPGQERHLPHEAWHVVQQLQGRVGQTLRGSDGTPINNDPSLEREADAMGARASAAVQRKAALPVGGRGVSARGAQATLQGQFFEKFEDGSYVWHDEAATARYHLLPETRRYHSWYNPLGLAYGAYPVYTRGAVDRSGKLVSEGLSTQEGQAVQAVFQAIQGTAYERILDALETRILHHLGNAALAQFYRGAHIVFQDDGQVYRDVFELGRPVGKFRNQGWGEWWRDEAVAETPGNLLPATTRGPGLGARRPERRETSHYGQDALPQLGIDLPGQLSGHVLVGIVPNDPYQHGTSAGHTFVQTEMYGFKNFSDHYLGHGQGFFWNFVASHQSGLVGYCKYSEKSGTEIREQDNPHVLQARFAGRSPVQRKVAFDDRDPILGVASGDALDAEVLRDLIDRMVHETLIGTGAVAPPAATMFTKSIVSDKIVNRVWRDKEGKVASDFDKLDHDPKSVFEFYRQRYRLQGVIEDWTRSSDGRYRHLYRQLRQLIEDGKFDGALRVLVNVQEPGDLHAAATDLYNDLESKALGGAGTDFLAFISKNWGIIHVPTIQQMFLPLILRALPKEMLDEKVRNLDGPKEKQPYGKHHGIAYSIGATSVFNYLADTFVEGFNPKTTSFAAFAIRSPHLGMSRPLATGSGGQVLADGWYMYVVDASLQMLYFPTHNYVQEDKAERSKVFAQYIPHTVLSGGEDVWAAGTFLVRDGRFALVDNGSGHYRPAPASLNVVRGLLNDLGYPTEGTRFVEFAETVKVGTQDRILPNLEGIEIGKVGKSGFTMDRPPRSPEVEDMLKKATK
jgi:Domain of unknown function (DUF4157)